jgi:C4-dicarboxylate transporter DctM subunit
VRTERSAVGVIRGIEEWLATAVLLLLGILPLAQALVRAVAQGGIPAYNAYLLHIVLAVAFLGGMITARDGRHLAIQVAAEILPKAGKNVVRIANALIATTFAFAFFWASLSFTIIGFELGARVGLFPIRLFAAVMPVGFLVMGIRFIIGAPGKPLHRFVVATGAVLGTIVGFSAVGSILYTSLPEIPLWLDRCYDAWFVLMEYGAIPLIILLIVGALTGVPLFIVLGGIALLLFGREGGAIEVVANEGYVLLTGNAIPAIPLFTLAGFFLSESRAGERLVRLFRALVGWMPGGLVIASVLVSTFFTTFTGASGVTILALGGLLLYVLVHSGSHTEDFSTGILTASGSIGLLFPPSLALIIYGSVAQVSIFDLFLGGIFPGLLVVAAMCAVGVFVAIRRKVPSVKFDPSEAWAALKESVWEILLPVIVVVVYFSGLATLVETAAVAVVYTLIIEVVVRREITARQLRDVAVKAAAIIGGVLMILALARALSYYIIDAGVPTRLSEWVASTIESRLLFLLLINLALLVAGMFMDIFSAILVIAPLVIPLGSLFGVDPVHLGIIFVANMGIGFITPPVGMNLFLAAYRFNIPLSRLYRNVAPFFLIQLVIVLVITYWPGLSTILLGR